MRSSSPTKIAFESVPSLYASMILNVTKRGSGATALNLLSIQPNAMLPRASLMLTVSPFERELKSVYYVIVASSKTIRESIYWAPKKRMKALIAMVNSAPTLVL